MAIEQGIVIAAHGPAPATARVKMVPPSACASCASRRNCSSAGGGKEREVDAINVANAKAGDRIQVSMDTAALLKATFLLYVFPIICMLVGGIVGNAAAVRLGFNTSLTSAAVAIGAFAAAMVFVRLRAGRLALKTAYRPKITRILSRGSTMALESAPGCELQTTNSI